MDVVVFDSMESGFRAKAFHPRAEVVECWPLLHAVALLELCRHAMSLLNLDSLPLVSSMETDTATAGSARARAGARATPSDRERRWPLAAAAAHAQFRPKLVHCCTLPPSAMHVAHAPVRVHDCLEHLHSRP